MFRINQDIDTQSISKGSLKSSSFIDNLFMCSSNLSGSE